MTYCIGIKTNEGLVFASDSRTNAGLDAVLLHCFICKVMQCSDLRLFHCGFLLNISNVYDEILCERWDAWLKMPLFLVLASF